ncbi:MAG: anti-sigma factor [Proteobacteria bacterium]|nr:anti-sigma factor [Pseudomonadota bacterium]
MSSAPITELDLHAYVDGRLDADRRAQVEAYLADHPEARVSLQHWREQNQALHRDYDGVLNEAIPLRLSTAVKAPSWPRGLAAGLAWLACGLVAGWFAHAARPLTPASMTSTASTASMQTAAGFARNALAAHVVFAAEKRHPVEVPAAQEAHLVAWLSKRLDAPIRAPDLQTQGFILLGGRLLPGDDAPLAQLMYESGDGERLTLTVRHAPQVQAETGFQVMEKNGVNAFYWIDRQYGYALSGSLGKTRLLAVANAVHAQLQP